MGRRVERFRAKLRNGRTRTVTFYSSAKRRQPRGIRIVIWISKRTAQHFLPFHDFYESCGETEQVMKKVVAAIKNVMERDKK
jgi:hypothetical protein